MKFKQSIALVICITFLLLISAGCADTDTDDTPEEDIATQDDVFEPSDEEHTHSELCDHMIDFDAAMATFTPDTVMISSGDLVITWAELYVFLFRTVANLMNAYGMEIDWEDTMDGISASDLIMESATEEALSFLTYMYGTKELNIVMSAADNEVFNNDLDAVAEMYGGKEAFEETLRENSGFSSFEVFEKLYRIEFSVILMVDKLYGEEASMFPDEDVEKFAREHDYMMALHILRVKTEEGDNTPLNEIEDILAELEPRVEDDDFIDFFKELMMEHSEDPGGINSFPDGYLFQHSDMVSEFSDACAGLEEGEISGIVETVYGYHIILRIPIDLDAVPISGSNDGIARTLRQVAAIEDFEEVRNKWRESLDLEFSDEYNSIDLASIFVFN